MSSSIPAVRVTVTMVAAMCGTPIRRSPFTTGARAKATRIASTSGTKMPWPR